MAKAHDTWNLATEPLESVERRIHDGVPLRDLHGRAQGYAKGILGHYFTEATIPPRSDANVVEIGPGLGYIMQAMMSETGVEKVIGLDIAEHMITHARKRILRDGLSFERFEFLHYDGVEFPFPNRSIDMFYSVAAIQHIPKPYAYNIFFEICRCLKPGGTAVIQLLHWNVILKDHVDLKAEISRQIKGANEHWHHYYDETEIGAILNSIGVYPDITNYDGALWVRWRMGHPATQENAVYQNKQRPNFFRRLLGH